MTDQGKPKHRSQALDKLIGELEEFCIPSDYYQDLEPQAAVDSYLNGKFDALAKYCVRVDWPDLLSAIINTLPLNASAPEALSTIQDYVLPEMRHAMARSDIDQTADQSDYFWALIHPRIAAIARPRIERGFMGDAVESSFKEVNDAVKRLALEAGHRELDGHGLMTTAFSLDNPIIRLNDLLSISERDEQKGYLQIYAGAMTGIRNPKAHANLNPPLAKTLHLVALASLLMHRLDERI